MTSASDLRYCPRCAGVLEWRPAGDARAPHPVCMACGYVLWQNPKPCVDALIRRGEGAATKVLLGRQSAGAAEGLWDAVGNFLNAGDEPVEALRRECLREVGVDVEVGELVGAFPGRFGDADIVVVVYACRIRSGEPYAAELVDAVGWFAFDALPPLASPITARAIEVLRARIARG